MHGLLIMQYQDGRVWRERDYEDVAALQRLGERLQAAASTAGAGYCAVRSLVGGAGLCWQDRGDSRRLARRSSRAAGAPAAQLRAAAARTRR